MSAGRPRWRATRIARSTATPAHQPGVRVVAAAAARLPDPFVGLVPVVHQPLEVADDLHPAVVVDGPPVLVAEVDGVHPATTGWISPRRNSSSNARKSSRHHAWVRGPPPTRR